MFKLSGRKRGGLDVTYVNNAIRRSGTTASVMPGRREPRGFHLGESWSLRPSYHSLDAIEDGRTDNQGYDTDWLALLNHY